MSHITQRLNRLFAKIKTILTNPKAVVCIVIIIASAVLGGVFFGQCYRRIWYALGDLWHSIIYYFAKLFLDLDPDVTVNNLKGVELPRLIILPENIELFIIKLKIYGKMLITLESLNVYGNYISSLLLWLSYFILAAVPIVCIAVVLGGMYEKQVNNDYAQDTKPTHVARWIYERAYLPVKRRVCKFCKFVIKNKRYWQICAAVWLFNINGVTIIIEVLAYYFYFAASLDFSTLYLQVYKLLLDISLPLYILPSWVLWITALILFDVWRRHKAQKIIDKYEEHDEDVVADLPLSSFAIGSQGTQKTTFITDLALTMQKYFRQTALDKMIKISLRFPDFPWILLEKNIQFLCDRHYVYNLKTMRDWINTLRHYHNIDGVNAKRAAARYMRAHRRYNYNNGMYGYDGTIYPTTYNDRLTVTDIFDAMQDYAQLYIIYCMISTLIVSNYGIRSDEVIDDKGNLPIVDNNFFKRNAAENIKRSQYSIINNFDGQRLGNKMCKDNPFVNAFELGIYAITEIGKERGNKDDYEGLKKSDETANPKNDLIPLDTMLDRHKCTVDFFPFVRNIYDDQRDQNLNAREREPVTVFAIQSSSDYKTPPVLFALDELLATFAGALYKKFYLIDRKNKGNNTLLKYVVDKIYNTINQHFIRITSKYSFSKVEFKVRCELVEGESQAVSYYLMKKKIHADRFNTAAYGGFYDYKYQNSTVGLNDCERYHSTTADIVELQKQNSYLINSLTKAFITCKEDEDGTTSYSEDVAAKSKTKRTKSKT
jgi:hypothetical protein